jgi:hypothetical protein
MAGDRLFVFGYGGRNAQDEAGGQWTRELAAKQPAIAPAPSITINNNSSVTITAVKQEITHVTIAVGHRAPIELALLEAVDLKARKQTGFFDPDHDFFLRTRGNGADLLQIGEAADGRRHLIASKKGGVSPLPADRSGDLFLFHEASGTLLPLSTDAKGELDLVLPDDVRGICHVFSMRGDTVSDAATIDIPR